MSTESAPVDASPDDDRFEKQVDVVEKDSEEQIARGAILVPDRVDHQGDFLREETVRDAAERYAERFDEGDVLPGVMHSVFVPDGVDLVESRVLDDPETIGTKTYPAGSWIQSYKYTDDELWALVSDDILGGFSIGGTAKGTVYDPGALPDDVTIPGPVQSELDAAGVTRDDISVREITQARILEVSSVDMPAVPDANISERKSLQKASPALTENVVVARLYLEERGLDPNDARRLAEYLQSRKASDTGGGSGLVSRAKSWFSKGDSAPADDASDDEGVIGASGRSTAGDGGAGSPADATEAAADANTDAETTSEMSDDKLDEALEAIEALTDEVGSVAERVDTIEAQIDSDGGAAGADADGDTETKADDGGADGAAMPPEVEEKFGDLAEAITQVAEGQSQLADAVGQQGEVLERMADAQGVSQQASDGTRSNGSTDKLWGENSPFAPNRGGR